MVRPAGRRPREVYHLRLRPGEIPRTVLLPGDPDRADRIARSWDRATPLAAHREFRSFRGRLGGVELGVVSVGIGGPAMTIVVEELARLGVRTLIRVGSSGPVDRGVRHGDVVVPYAAYRLDGAGLAYAPLGYPAVASPRVFRALSEAAADLGVRYHEGITASVDSFYVAQGRPGFGGFLPRFAREAPKRLRTLGITNVEMETATLFVAARVLGLEAGASLAVFGDGPDGLPIPGGESDAIRVANEAARRLSSRSVSAGVDAPRSAGARRPTDRRPGPRRRPRT